MSTSAKEHWTIVKRVFRYLHGTTYFAIFYHKSYKEVRVHGFIDSNWNGDIDGRQSTSGYVLTLFGGAINQMRRNEFMVDLSTIEDKYVVATHARKEAISMQQLCIHIWFKQQVVRLGFDNQSEIFLVENLAYH